MYDRRVIRGTTCNTQNQNLSSNEDLSERHKEARRRALVRKKARGISALRRGRHGTPPPAPGRRHEPVQTDQYLEEIIDPPPESEAACQTDLFLEQITAPAYYAAPNGIEKSTQVYPGELIDLEEVLDPIVQSMVNRTLEKSLLEVLEEEQQAELKAQQRCLREFEALKEDDELALSPRALRLHHGVTSTTGLYYLIIDGTQVAAIIMDILQELQQNGRLAQDIELPPAGFLQDVLDALENMTRSRPVIRDIVEELLRGRGLLLPYEDLLGEAEEIPIDIIHPEWEGEEERYFVPGPEDEVLVGEETTTEQPIHPHDQLYFGEEE